MTGNASLSQYAPPPTTCMECAPPGDRLPHTGLDLGFEATFGGLALLVGVVLAVIVRRWS